MTRCRCRITRWQTGHECLRGSDYSSVPIVSVMKVRRRQCPGAEFYSGLGKRTCAVRMRAESSITDVGSKSNVLKVIHSDRTLRPSSRSPSSRETWAAEGNSGQGPADLAAPVRRGYSVRRRRAASRRWRCGLPDQRRVHIVKGCRLEVIRIRGADAGPTPVHGTGSRFRTTPASAAAAANTSANWSRAATRRTGRPG